MNSNQENGVLQSCEDFETRLFIDNEFVPGTEGATFEVINPATEAVVANVHEAREADVDRAVAAAHKAFPAWSELGGFQRAAYFYRLADLYERHHSQLGEIEAQCMGRPISTYREPLASASFLRYMAGKATDIQGESSLQTTGFWSLSLRQPFGVCAAITPFNAPVTMMTFKMAPCLIAGNTMVLKTSEEAPLTALYIAKLVQEAGFPPGVLNVLSGFGPRCGAAMALHPQIRKISFTGSAKVGRAIKKAAAESNMKRVTLELGGKSPLIVFEDANIQKAAQAACTSILLNSGQACVASSRVYVHSKVADEFCRQLVMLMDDAGRNPEGDGNPLLPSTKRGPQASRQQYETIKAFLREAKEKGCEFLLGGEPEPGTGYFIQPTIVYQPEEKSRLMQEEIFGPVQCVCTFESEEDVLTRANETEYGLYASVFTKDIFRALRIAKRFEAGNVGVNVSSPWMQHDMPFGGWKQSGDGVELGAYAVREWTELKTVYLASS